MSDEWNRSQQEAWEELMQSYPQAEPAIAAAYARDVEVAQLRRETTELRKRVRDLEERTQILAGNLNQFGPLLAYLNAKKRGPEPEQPALKGTL